MNKLTALSPLDGRYAEKVSELTDFFSEYGLIKYRVIVELRWLISLSNHQEIKQIPPFSEKTVHQIEQLIANFSVDFADQIKQIEKTTNHDVKAVEYWLKDYFADNQEINNAQEFIHFACTSEDINNLAYGLMLYQAREKVLLPFLQQLIDKLRDLAHDLADCAMISRTHGQSASPTTMGKEIANWIYRINRQIDQLKNQPILGKINGAVGNFNAHTISYPEIDWQKHSQYFIENNLKLQFNPYTTQIEPHDYIAEYLQIFTRINNILIDLNRDIWGYISFGYFGQKIKEGEIGSSTMPHKVNPIDFENSEGNLQLANALLQFFAEKLPISRFQRDLTDSTVLRNIGVSLGYCLLGYKSCLTGLNKLQIAKPVINQTLQNSWELLAEPIQTILRINGVSNPYEKLKELTRGKKNITQKDLHDFIDKLAVDDDLKQNLKQLTPENYLGIAEKLAKNI